MILLLFRVFLRILEYFSVFDVTVVFYVFMYLICTNLNVYVYFKGHVRVHQ